MQSVIRDSEARIIICIITDANIPYLRLHDIRGACGRNVYVDIPNSFRDFDANEYALAKTAVMLANLGKSTEIETDFECQHIYLVDSEHFFA